jgi:hypothetical protein
MLYEFAGSRLRNYAPQFGVQDVPGVAAWVSQA